MTVHHELSGGRWWTLGIVEQLANVGSEVGRALGARRAGRRERADSAFARALELLDLTSADPRWGGRRLREIRRAREELCRLYLGDPSEDSAAGFEKYFLAFALAARRSPQGHPSSIVPR